jgi:hypothetical protein
MQLKYSSINYNHKNYIVQVPSLPNEQGQIIFLYSVNEVEKSFIRLTYNVFVINSHFNCEQKSEIAEKRPTVET